MLLAPAAPAPPRSTEPVDHYPDVERGTTEDLEHLQRERAELYDSEEFQNQPNDPVDFSDLPPAVEPGDGD